MGFMHGQRDRAVGEGLSKLLLVRLAHELHVSRVWGGWMPITATVLYDLVNCPQRVALDAFGDASRRDAANPFVQLLWERGTRYEREVIGRLDRPYLDLSGISDGERERLTLKAMRRGEALI